MSSEGNLKEIEEDSLRALRGMQGQLQGIHFTIYWRLKRCPFEIFLKLHRIHIWDLRGFEERSEGHLFVWITIVKRILRIERASKGIPFGF